MRMDDKTRLEHMLAAATETLGFVKSQNYDLFEMNRVLVLAVLQELIIIGEAANKISPETMEAYPHIPWRVIVGMRNRLVHAYFDIDIDVVWKTATEELPRLVDALEEALA